MGVPVEVRVMERGAQTLVRVFLAARGLSSRTCQEKGKCRTVGHTQNRDGQSAVPLLPWRQHLLFYNRFAAAPE
jgi:hypothetical protein